MKFFKSDFSRFLFVGSINTVVTYLVYLFFLSLMSYQLAYSFTYLLGIYFSYYLNCRLVFHESPRWSSVIQYPLVYAVQYMLGFLLLYGLVALLGVSESVAPLIVIAATVPVTFLLSRRIIRG